MTDLPEQDFLFDDEDYAEDVFFEDALPLELDKDELILTHLLKKSLISHGLGPVTAVQDFVELVIPNLVNLLELDSAKGGEFAQRKLEEGRDPSHYLRDQSLRAHILNGLLATLHIYRLALDAGNSQARLLGDYGERLLIATYILHDYTKLPAVAEAFEGISSTPSRESISQIRFILGNLAEELNLPEFFQAGGQVLNLDDLTFGVSNTQVRWGTAPTHLFDNLGDRRGLNMVAQLSRIADLLAYGTFLEDANLERLNQILSETLIDRPFDLTPHRVTQVTGALTAFIHNGIIDAMRNEGHEPILFASNGVIYASPRSAKYPDVDTVTEDVMNNLLDAIQNGIRRHATGISPIGFGWGTQGIKDAPLFQQLLTIPQRLEVVWTHLQRNLMSPKARQRNSLKVYKRLQSGIDNGWTPWFTTDNIESYIQYIDQRAEAIGDWLAYAYTIDDSIGNLILQVLDFDPAEHRELIETANRGGVRYWTALIAVQYIASHPTLTPYEVNLLITQEVLPYINNQTNNTLAESTSLDTVRDHISQTIVFPDRISIEPVLPFQHQLEIYEVAKTDRQKGVYDTIYHLSEGIEPQQETSLPYMPTPYSQRLPLGAGDGLNSGWRRGISAVGVINMTLMQLTLKQPFQFEKRKGKMLFIYPVYYFTAETGEVLIDVLRRLQAFSIADWLKHTDNGLNLTATQINRYHPLLERPAKWSPPVQLMQFPISSAPTFAQMALDGGNDPTDAESWVNAVFISLILATVIDVKIVASESPVPLYQSGTEFNETIRFDALHAGFSDLIGRKIIIDKILPALQRASILMAVIVDGYGYKFDYVASLGRDLGTDPSKVFGVYRRVLDKAGNNLPPIIAHRYIRYAEILQETGQHPERSSTLNYAREMVTIYRQFYRAKGFASNAILRPVQEAADIIVKVDPAHSDPEMLVDMIQGKLIQIETGMIGRDIQGYLPRGSDPQQRREAMRKFAEYFVYDYFQQALKGRKASLRGTQFNLLRMACDAVYRDLDTQDRMQLDTEGRI